MTVKLLSSWKDQPAGTLYTTDSVTEATMVTAKVATSNLAGGVVWSPNVGDPNPGHGEPLFAARDLLTGKMSGFSDPKDGAFIPLGSTSAISAVTYNASSKVSGYVNNGTSHVVSYPDATHIVDVGGGFTKTVTLDASGRIISIAVA